MRRPKPQTTAGWIVSIAGIDTRFTRVSGLEGTRTITDYNDGYSHEARKMASPMTYGEVTLEKPYELEIDDPLISLVQDYCSEDDAGIDIVLTPVGLCNKDTRGRGKVLKNCIPVSFSIGDIDRNGDGVQMLTLVVAPQSIS